MAYNSDLFPTILWSGWAVSVCLFVQLFWAGELACLAAYLLGHLILFHMASHSPVGSTDFLIWQS